MAKHQPGGAFYSTDDLLKMAQLGHFGNYSPVIYRALVRLKKLEVENTDLKATVSAYERIDEIRKEYESDTPPDEPSGAVIDDLSDLY